MHKDGRRFLFHFAKCPTLDGRENGGFYTSRAQGIMVGRDPLNEEVICLTLTDKNIQFRAKIGRRRSRVRLRTALKRFCFKIEHFSLI